MKTSSVLSCKTELTVDVALTIVNTGEKKKKIPLWGRANLKILPARIPFLSRLHSEPHNYSPISEDPGSMRLSYRIKNK